MMLTTCTGILLPLVKISTIVIFLLVLSVPTITAFQVSFKSTMSAVASASTSTSTSNGQPIVTTTNTNIHPLATTMSMISIRHSRSSSSSSSSSSSQLAASKENKSKRRGEGFGNIPTSTKATSGSPKTEESLPKPTTTASTTASAIENNTNNNKIATSINNNNNIPVQERTASILREQYGLRTIEEQQMDAKQLKIYKEQQKEISEWKKKVLSTNDGNGDIDILSLIPAPIIIGIDRLLKVGLGISSIVFIVSGVLVTLEAYTKATTNDILPLYLTELVVNVIQPNFTIGLGIVLTFSILLGILATAQLSSTNASYREK